MLPAEAGFGGDPAVLLLEPFTKGGDHMRGAGLPGRRALSGRLFTDVGFDGIGPGDMAKPSAAICEPSVSNTCFSLRRAWLQQMGHVDGIATLSGRTRQAFIALITVKLESAIEADKKAFGVLAGASWRIKLDYPRRIVSGRFILLKKGT